MSVYKKKLTIYHVLNVDTYLFKTFLCGNRNLQIIASKRKFKISDIITFKEVDFGALTGRSSNQFEIISIAGNEDLENDLGENHIDLEIKPVVYG